MEHCGSGPDGYSWPEYEAWAGEREGDVHDVEKACDELAAKQYGLISRKQASDLGLSDHQIASRLAWKRWRKLRPSVFVVGSQRDSFRQRLMGVALWAGKDALLSHRSAAALFGFSRFQFKGVGLPIDVIATRRLDADGVTVRRTQVATEDRITHLGLPVTSVPRTLIDLCATVPIEDVRAALEMQLARRRTKLWHLTQVANRSSSVAGVAAFRRLLEPYLEGAAPTESVLESVVRDLLERHGFLFLQRQFEIFTANKRVYRMDFKFPGLPLVIEVDGFQFHASPEAFRKDQARNNELVAQGVFVIRWNWWDVMERPDELIAQLRSTVERLSVAQRGT